MECGLLRGSRRRSDQERRGPPRRESASLHLTTVKDTLQPVLGDQELQPLTIVVNFLWTYL